MALSLSESESHTDLALSPSFVHLSQGMVTLDCPLPMGGRGPLPIPIDLLGGLACMLASMKETGVSDRKSTRLNSSHLA